MTSPIVGSGQNDIFPFATGEGANVESAAQWQADAVRQQGFQAGIADSRQGNTAFRQASFIASMIGQFTADFSGLHTADDGNVAALENNYIAALQSLLQPLGVYFVLDTGTANAVVGTSSNAPTSYVSPGFVVFKKMSSPNTGTMTITLWGLTTLALHDNTGAGLASGALLGGAFYIAAYDGGAYRVLGGAATYTTVTNLTANSGDMIAVDTGGLVNFRTLRGTHNTSPASLDRWPRGAATSDGGLYMSTAELIAYLQPLMSIATNIVAWSAAGIYTYTPTVGAQRALMFATGPGGSGSANPYGGGGGGSGATAIATTLLAGITSLQVTIGTGGQAPTSVGQGSAGQGITSIGGLAMAGPGSGGKNVTAYYQFDLGGDGGIATVGNLLLIPGNPGANAYYGSSPGSGYGGSSFWGGVGRGQWRNVQNATSGSLGSGGGGAGAAGLPAPGSGGDGVAVIVEF